MVGEKLTEAIGIVGSVGRDANWVCNMPFYLPQIAQLDIYLNNEDSGFCRKLGITNPAEFLFSFGIPVVSGDIKGHRVPVDSCSHRQNLPTEILIDHRRLGSSLKVTSWRQTDQNQSKSHRLKNDSWTSRPRSCLGYKNELQTWGCILAFQQWSL